MDDQRIAQLIEIARQVRERAYAPYSNFAVGAVVECRDGSVYTGCNVENASYGLTICAERVALSKAISEGARDLIRVVVIADTQDPVPPCGACRQLIHELAGPEAEVVMANMRGRIEVARCIELLPSPFHRNFF